MSEVWRNVYHNVIEHEEVLLFVLSEQLPEPKDKQFTIIYDKEKQKLDTSDTLKINVLYFCFWNDQKSFQLGFFQ